MLRNHRPGGAVSAGRPRSPKAPLVRLALAPTEAAAVLGVSFDYYTEHIASEIRLVRRGRKRLVPVAELDRWLMENANRALEAEEAPR